MDYKIPGYLIIKETGRRRIRDDARETAMRFDVKMARCRGGTIIMKECWKRWAEDRGLENAIG